MPKILVIDDEKPIRDALQNILTAEQYQVDLAENGKKGLELLNDNGYDVVLCDIKMPNMDGLETTRQLLSPSFSNWGHKPFVVGLTAHSLASEMQACLDAGMETVLSKPIDPEAVSLALQKYLGRPFDGH